MSWYVVHVKPGFESLAIKSLKDRAKQFNIPLGEVLAPPPKTVELLSPGSKTPRSTRVDPGYVFVQYEFRLGVPLTPAQGLTALKAHSLWKVLVGASAVTGYLKVEGLDRAQDVEISRLRKAFFGSEQNLDRFSYRVGETVKVIDGPFQGFSGKVEEVKLHQGKVRINIPMFGRSTPTDIDLAQVSKG